MAFADHYLKRYTNYKPFIDSPPADALNGIIVIPSYNEPDIVPSLQSLYNCKPVNAQYEIIVVLNSGIRDDDQVLAQNKKTIQQIQQFRDTHSHLNLSIKYFEITDVPHKFAGVGNARKTGFDEAIFRFNQLDKAGGLLIAFDADSKVSANYLQEIELHFDQNEKLNGCSIFYEHPLEGSEYSTEIYMQVAQYELHLRYMNQMLRQISYPYAFQTVGSSFAVRASAYIRQNGMNRRKAGEDFYFLQKIISLENYDDLTSCTVYPSPRESDRVPFGTGAAMRKQILNNLNTYFTYHPDAYAILQHFFSQLAEFYNLKSDIESIYQELPEAIRDYLSFSELEQSIIEIRKHTKDLPRFLKRFYQWFNAFKVIKYLNFVHEKHFEKIPVIEAAQMLKKSNDVYELLDYYRQQERKQNYEVKYIIPQIPQ